MLFPASSLFVFFSFFLKTESSFYQFPFQLLLALLCLLIGWLLSKIHAPLSPTALLLLLPW